MNRTTISGNTSTTETAIYRCPFCGIEDSDHGMTERVTPGEQPGLLQCGSCLRWFQAKPIRWQILAAR